MHGSSKEAPAISGRRALVGGLAAFLAASVIASSGFASVAAMVPPTVPPGHAKLHVNDTAGEIQGVFVQFKTPDTDVIIQDFVSNGTAFFDSISAAGYVKKNASIAGAELQIQGSNVDAQIHDNPNALAKFTVDGGVTLVFDLSSGLVASPGENQSSFNLSVADSNRTAKVWWHCDNTTGTLAAGGHRIEVAPQATCRVYFRSHIDNEESDDEISAAAESGLLMAEIRIGDDQLDGDVAGYGETSLVVARNVEGVSVSMGPEGDRPGSIVIHFVPGGSGAPVVTVDGREIHLADSLADALDPTDDGERLEYAIVPNADGTSVLVVSVPDEASHVVQIQTASATVQPTARDLTPAVVGVAVAMALTAGAAVALFRRR